MEGKRFEYALLSSVIPLARTPMDKKGAKAMDKMSKELSKYLTKTLTPWDSGPLSTKARVNKYGGRVKSGEIAVVLGPGEGGLADVFKDSKIVKA